MGIRKQSLDPSLVQWIMTQTGLGPGIGEMFWVAPASSATSQFRTQLQRWGVEQNYKIHTDPVDAHDAMVAGRNDVMLVMPGTYTVADTAAAPMTWSKDYTHMIGLANPQRSTGAGAVIRTTSATGVFAMQNTADQCQFHNIAWQQWGSAAAALSVVEEIGHENRYVNCLMFGHIRSNIAALTTGSSLKIGGATDAGANNLYDNCVIGGTGGSKRTAVSGVILFDSDAYYAGVGKNSKFDNCMINSWAEDTDPCAVLLTEQYSADRLILFEGCTFYNFRLNHSATMPSYVFHHVRTTSYTHDFLLKNCARLGFTAWCSDPHFVFSADALGETDGGEAKAADVS